MEWPREGRIKAGVFHSSWVSINHIEFNWKQWYFLWREDKRMEAVNYIDMSVLIR